MKTAQKFFMFDILFSDYLQNILWNDINLQKHIYNIEKSLAVSPYY